MTTMSVGLSVGSFPDTRPSSTILSIRFNVLISFAISPFIASAGFTLISTSSSAKICRSCLTDRCVFPFEELTLSRLLRHHGIDWEIGNYAFGAEAGHAFLEAVIENCVRAQRDRPG